MKTKFWVLFLLAAAAACSGDDGVPDYSDLDPNRGLTGGIGAPTVHRFDRGPADLEGWSSSSAAWTVDGGAVVGRNTHNQALWRRERIAPAVRIEFEASAPSGGDIRFEVFGDGEHHESGYVLAYNAWGGAAHVLSRLDEHGEQRTVVPITKPIDKGKTYRMAVVRSDASVRWFVDGSLLLEFVDEAPLTGPGHDRFGLNSWSSDVHFDNIRVFTLGDEVSR